MRKIKKEALPRQSAERPSLENAAVELSKVLDLEPPIALDVSDDALKIVLIEANSMVTESDDISAATRALLSVLAKEMKVIDAGKDEVKIDAGKDEKVEKTNETKPKVKAEKKVSIGGAWGNKKYHDAAQIKLLVAENPKKKGSAAHERFKLYASAKTVADYLAAGGLRGDLSWDVCHKFITTV